MLDQDLNLVLRNHKYTQFLTREFLNSVKIMGFLTRSLQFIFVSILPTINTALVMILRKGKHLRQVSPCRPASDAQVHSGLWGAACPLPGPTSGDRRRYGRGGRKDWRVATTKARALRPGNPNWSRWTPGRWPLRHPGPRSPPGSPHRYLIRAHVRSVPSELRASPRSLSPSPAGHDPTPPLQVRASPSLC